MGSPTSWAMRMKAQLTELAVADTTLMGPIAPPSSFLIGCLSRAVSPLNLMAHGEEPSTVSFGPYPAS